MVEKVDGELAKVLGALRTAGFEDKTLVIFTSDHGDCVGAHRFNQKTVFYEESVRIPLIVSWKGNTVPSLSDRLVNTGVDILPTMLACAGIEQPRQLPGRSLLPLALGKRDVEWREYLVSQNNLAQTGVVDGIKPTMEGRMVRTGRYKYCLYQYGNRREALYDMQKDPQEKRNLAGDPLHSEVVRENRKRLRRFGKTHDDELVEKLLANNVGPRPFEAGQPAKRRRKGNR